MSFRVINRWSSLCTLLYRGVNVLPSIYPSIHRIAYWLWNIWVLDGVVWTWQRSVQLEAFRMTHTQQTHTDWNRVSRNSESPVAASPLDRQDVNETKSASRMTARSPVEFSLTGIQFSAAGLHSSCAIPELMCSVWQKLFYTHTHTHVHIHTVSSIGRARKPRNCS